MIWIFEICKILKTERKKKEWKKEKCSILTTHAKYFIYGYIASDMFMDYKDFDRKTPLPPLHGAFLLFSTKGFPYTHHFTARQHTLDTPAVEQWLVREIAHWVHHVGSILLCVRYWSWWVCAEDVVSTVSMFFVRIYFRGAFHPVLHNWC